MTTAAPPPRHDPLEANIAVVRTLVERVVNGRDDAGLDEVLSDDFVAHDVGPGMPPGKDGMRALLRAWRRAFPDWHDTLEDVVAQHDLVVMRITASGTHLGPIAGIAPTGERVTWHMIEIVRVRDGRISEQWGQSDFGAVLAHLREVAARA
jgi:predicted ester cyclase